MLKEKKVIPLISLVCLMTLTPSYDALMSLYFIKRLSFSQIDLANLATIGTLFYLMALLLYQTYLKRFSSRAIFILTNFLQAFLNYLFMLVMYQGTSQYLGNSKLFCIITQSLSSFIGELNFIPILTTWCLLCPDNLEATSVTLITGIQNLCGNLSNYLGVLVLRLSKVDEETLEGVERPLWIQSHYFLVLALVSPFVVFPLTKTVGSQRSLKSKEQLK